MDRKEQSHPYSAPVPPIDLGIDLPQPPAIVSSGESLPAGLTVGSPAGASVGDAAIGVTDKAEGPVVLPKSLVAASGYLELATGPAAKLGLAPQLKRRMLRLAVRHASGTVGGESRSVRHFVLGQSLRLLGRYDIAAKALRLAARDRNLRRDALLGLAWCLRRTGALDEAIAVITRALAAAPEDAALHYNLACYLALAVQPRAALYELAWALELNPRLRRRASVECDFDLLRGTAAFEALTDPARQASQRPAGP